MAIDPVSYNGKSVDINESNAKEIYKAYRKGEVELDTAQRKYAESFLTRADYDEIDYDTDVANYEGRGQIEDAENADKYNEGGEKRAGMVASEAAGGTVSVASAVEGALFGPAAQLAMSKCQAGTVWAPIALILGGIAALLGGSALATALTFDTGYKERVQAEGNSENTNNVLDNNSAVLEDSMQAMNEDMETYSYLSEEHTQTLNTKASDMASLQIQLMDAQAAGDTEGEEQIREQMKHLDKMDFASEESALEDTKAQLDAYRSANTTAGGVNNAGKSVTAFLKEGTQLGIVGGINTIALGVATIFAGLATLKSTVSWKAPFEVPVALAATALFAVATGLFAASTVIMGKKTVNEIKCAVAGNEMQTHVDSLDDMIGQQNGYIDTTSESYGADDQLSEQNQEKANEAAAKAVAKAGGSMGPNNGGGKSGGGFGTLTFTPSGTGGDSGGSSGGSSGGGSSSTSV